MTLQWSRRDILRAGLASALGSTGARGALGLLAAANASVARAAFNDYKALVCIFLNGGNDGYNTLVPNDGRYDSYRSARSNLALSPLQLLPLAGVPYSVHQRVPQLRELFAGRRLAFVANVGPLLAPTSKAEALAQTNLPPRLFSHNDQQDTWMSSEPDSATRLGWGGRLADLLASANGSSQLSMNISIAGNNLFQIGQSTVPYTVTPDQVQQFNALTGTDERTAQRAAITRRLLTQSAGASVYERYLGQLTERSIDLGVEVSAALAQGPALTTAFPDSRLANQMQMVARLIGVRQRLGVARQVYFVSLGGFDTHDSQLLTQAALLAQLSEAISAFHAATVELGVADAVTAFTASDFGRTLTSNGDGSDHAWGNVHWVVGGAVRGGEIYGQFPNLTLNGPDDMNNGRLIPTTSVEQYGATLLRWFGAAESEIDTVFPHLSRFATRGLAYL